MHAFLFSITYPYIIPESWAPLFIFVPEASQPALRDLRRLPGQRAMGRGLLCLSHGRKKKDKIPSGRSSVVRDRCAQRHGREWCQRQLPALNVATENPALTQDLSQSVMVGIDQSRAVWKP